MPLSLHGVGAGSLVVSPLMYGCGEIGAGGMRGWRWWMALALVAGGCIARALAVSSPANSVAFITNAQQVLALGLDRARGTELPVRLRGTLTYEAIFGPGWFCLQDDSGAVLVNVHPAPKFARNAGQVVEVEGVAAAGIYLPFVQGTNATLIGSGPLPKPKRTTAAPLVAGEDFARWVSVEATILDVAVSKGRAVFLCSDHGILFQTWANYRDNFHVPTELLDARVEIQGVAWTDVGYERKPFGFKLHNAGTNFIKVLKPGDADVFNKPVTPMRSLYRPAGESVQRVKVTGVVTLYSPVGWLFLQDESAALLAFKLPALPHDEDPNSRYVPRDQPELRPGDRIEIVGTPMPDRPFAPAFREAEYRVIGRAPLPSPRAVSVREIMSGKHDATLVRLKARVIDVEERKTGVIEQKLWLQADETLFEAAWEVTDGKFLQLQKDDFVDLSGVCVVRPGQLKQVRSFSVRVRGPQDLAIANPTRWWMLRWMAWLAAGGGVLAVAAAVWITLLRRQVRSRTAELSATNHLLNEEVTKRQGVEVDLRDALAAEKELNQLKGNFVSMVSHEFRTPLGAIQTSAELLRNYHDRLPADRRARLLEAIVSSSSDMARMMEDVLLLSRVETARYDFQPRETNLSEFCQRLADEMASASHGRCPIEIQLGELPKAAWCDEGLLRHIFNNLLSNAVKYSAPGTPVLFRVEKSGDDAVFVIQDRGLGIPTEDQPRIFQAFTRGRNVGDTPGTGLGLVIVQRCAALHGGTVSVTSAVGQGTTVTVRLPLFAPRESDTTFARRRAAAAQPNGL